MFEKRERKEYAFRRQFNEKPSIIPGCPGLAVFEASVFEAALHAEADGSRVFYVFMWLVNRLQSGKACSIQHKMASQRISACWS